MLSALVSASVPVLCLCLCSLSLCLFFFSFLSTQTAAEGLHAEDSANYRRFHRLKFQLRLWAIEALYHATNFVSRLREWFGYSSTRFENLIENTMAQSLENRLGFRVGVQDGDVG